MSRVPRIARADLQPHPAQHLTKKGQVVQDMAIFASIIGEDWDWTRHSKSLNFGDGHHDGDRGSWSVPAWRGQARL